MKKHRPSLLAAAPVVALAVALASAVFGFAACAEGDPALPPSGGVDAGDAGPAMQDPDATTPEGDASDAGRDDCGPVCCPGASRCIDEATVGECNLSGTLLVPTSCAEGDECVDGACVTAPVCQPGSTRCFDTSTLLTCRANATGYATEPCPAETTCFEGRCVSGDASGSACAADEACASGTCRCGAGTDDACPGAPATGYCASSGCDGASCPADAACFQAGAAPLGAAAVDYDHCVQLCPSGACADPALSCVQAPVLGAEGPAWTRVCYLPGYVPLGAACGPGAPCIGGECLTGYYDTSYCTRRCDDDGICPDGFGCVALRAGEFYCSELCGDGSPLGSQDCPFDAEDRFDVTCRILPTYDGASLRACATPP